MITDEMVVVDIAYKWKDAIEDHLTSLSVAYSLISDDRKSHIVEWTAALELEMFVVSDFIDKETGRSLGRGKRTKLYRINIEIGDRSPIIKIQRMFSDHVIGHTSIYYDLKSALSDLRLKK